MEKIVLLLSYSGQTVLQLIVDVDKLSKHCMNVLYLTCAQLTLIAFIANPVSSGMCYLTVLH